MMGPTMNLISETYHSYERREYAFIVLQEYTIIFSFYKVKVNKCFKSIDLVIIFRKFL